MLMFTPSAFELLTDTLLGDIACKLGLTLGHLQETYIPMGLFRHECVATRLGHELLKAMTTAWSVELGISCTIECSDLASTS
jgi:hypothetical protein